MIYDVVARVSGAETHRLFVYGTLMKGGEAHWLLDNAIFLGSASTASKYSLNELGNDFYAIGVGNNCIDGELYMIDSPTLYAIDNWEYSIYSRESIELFDGSTALTYMI